MDDPTATPPPYEDDDDILGSLPDVDRHSCQLLGPTALIVQGLMGILVILSLVYKRQRETVRRPWRIWLFDVSKQVLGQLFVHLLNLMISDVGAHHSAGNPCVYYFLNILIDTTFGVSVIYVNLRILTYLLVERLQFKGLKSGQYGDPPSIHYWVRQAGVYLVALAFMKVAIIALFAIWPGIFKIGEWLLSWTGGSGGIQVVFVMGIFPILMNILQFWIIDNIVKATTDVVKDDHHESQQDGSHEPLFNAPDDDDDDEAYPSRPRAHDIEDPPPRSQDGSEVSRKFETHDTSGSGKTDFGSNTPHLQGGHSRSVYSYPPRSASPSSARSPSSVKTPSTSGSLQRTGRRRSPPPALLPRSPMQPALNVYTPSPASTPAKLVSSAQGVVSNSKSSADPVIWDTAWIEGDDWADRVGEEDWTGKRMETRKGVVADAWSRASIGMDSSPIPVG